MSVFLLLFRWSHSRCWLALGEQLWENWDGRIKLGLELEWELQAISSPSQDGPVSLPTHFTPRHTWGDFCSQPVPSRNSAGAGFLRALGRTGKRPGCFQTGGASLNPLGKEGGVEEEPGMLPPAAVSWGAEGLRAEIPDGKRVSSLIKMFWV